MGFHRRTINSKLLMTIWKEQGINGIKCLFSTGSINATDQFSVKIMMTLSEDREDLDRTLSNLFNEFRDIS